MKRNKRAALELSITAIVVLIIAITILGLGIGFIKKQFGAGTELVGGELTKIKQQLKDQVRTGGDLLVFNVPEEISIGKPKNTFIGVRNTAANPNSDKDRVCFRVEVKCIKPFTPGSACDPSIGLPGGNNVAVGGYDYENQDYVVTIAPQRNWFRSILGEFDLKNYEGDVYDAVMLVRGIKPDSYAMEINVYKDPESNSCADQQFGLRSRSEDLYTSRTFTLKVI